METVGRRFFGAGVSPATRLVLVGGAAVVAFDATASLVLSWLGQSLVWMFLGEGLFYLGVGSAGARIGGLGTSARIGAGVAAIDSTVGWAVTWLIGPGQVSRLTPIGVVFILTVMITTGAVAGCVGGVAARLLGRSTS